MADSFNNLGLKQSLVNALAKQNITIPTEIQSKVIPVVMEKKDVIVQSETGTGKTLAYLIPLFEKLVTEDRLMQCIILAPTHELAIQIQRQIEHLSENSEIKIFSCPIIGNVNIKRQIEKLREKPQIVVGSAGRILELIKLKKIAAHTVKTIIIDEADRLMDNSNIEGIKAVIKCTLRERQLMMFSATISQETIVKAKEIMQEPEILRGEEKASVPEAIEHLFFLTEKRDKDETLRKLIKIMNPVKAIVFVNQSFEIEKVTAKLQYHGLKADGIHGTNIKLDRKKTMEDFRIGRIQVLVASDLAARGLDIEGVTHIFNMDMPEDAKDYLHRAGRTGRVGKAGIVVSVVTEREIPLVKMYEKTFKIEITQSEMSKGLIVKAKPHLA